MKRFALICFALPRGAGNISPAFERWGGFGSLVVIGALWLLAMACIPSAGAQSGSLPHKSGLASPPMTEPLEKYNMPPAYIYRLESSPRMISQFGPFTSYQVNVDQNGNNRSEE